MDPWVLNTLAFLAVFFAVFSANAILLGLGAGERRRLKQELREQLRQRKREQIKSLDLSRVARVVNSPKVTRGQSLATLVDQSGLNLSVRRLVLMCVGTAVVAGLLVGGLTTSLLLAAVAALASAVFPVLWVIYARNKRLEKLRTQLPDALDLMSRVLQAGQTMSQAMQLVADEFSLPISLEFFFCHEQMNLGLSPDDAMRDLARRTGLLEIKIFVLAVVVHQQTGGNLSELLDKMGAVVRERLRIRGMVQSLTAQGRMQATILLSLPPAMFLLLMVINPDYESLLLQYPMMIVAALALMGVGALWIQKVIHFDF